MLELFNYLGTNSHDQRERHGRAAEAVVPAVWEALSWSPQTDVLSLPSWELCCDEGNSHQQTISYIIICVSPPVHTLRPDPPRCWCLEAGPFGGD